MSLAGAGACSEAWAGPTLFSLETLYDDKTRSREPKQRSNGRVGQWPEAHGVLQMGRWEEPPAQPAVVKFRPEKKWGGGGVKRRGGGW